DRELVRLKPTEIEDVGVGVEVDVGIASPTPDNMGRCHGALPMDQTRSPLVTKSLVHLAGAVNDARCEARLRRTRKLSPAGSGSVKPARRPRRSGPKCDSRINAKGMDATARGTHTATAPCYAGRAGCQGGPKWTSGSSISTTASPTAA